MKYIPIYLYLFIILSISCSKLEPHEATSGEADFTAIVALGGNYLSGYSNGAISRTSQENSLANLIAIQLQEAGGGEFNQPTIDDEDGLGLNIRPWDSDFHSKSHLGDRTDCEGEVSFGPVKSLFNSNETSLLGSISGTFHNYATPYVTMAQYDDASLGLSYDNGGSPYYSRFASSTIMDDVMATNPTFSILWLGMEEIYGYAMRGGTGSHIPLPENTKIDSILKVISSSGGKGVIATIPSIESFPYFNLIPYNGAVLRQGQADTLNSLVAGAADWDHIEFKEGENGFLIRDSSRVVGYDQMRDGEKLLFSVPLDSIRCFLWGVLGNPLPSIHVLDEFELAAINASITNYNSYISNKAAEYDFALVDMHNYFNRLGAGVLSNGVGYNLEFVSGGFISLDGYHPTSKGYALIANQFIEAINEEYDASVPMTTCPDCRGTEFPKE